MNQENARELQGFMARDALNLLCISGAGAETELHKRSITLLGKAWQLPQDATDSCLALIRQGEELAAQNPEDHETRTKLISELSPDEDVFRGASGRQTLDMIMDMFETAAALEHTEERNVMLNAARYLEESQNILDWIVKSQAEKQEIAEIISASLTA